MRVAHTQAYSWAIQEVMTINDPIAAGVGEGQIYADKQLVVTSTLVPSGLMFAGEIDAFNVHAVGESLATVLARASDVHVDLRRLVFCDISGIRAFVWAAEGLNGKHRLALHGLPDQLEHVMRVVGWDQLPSLDLCSCGVEQP